MIPQPNGAFIFLWGNERFRYYDVRTVNALIDGEVFDALRETGAPHEASFEQYLGEKYLAGRAYRSSDGDIAAIAVVGPDDWTLQPYQFRWWWRFLTRSTL